MSQPTLHQAVPKKELAEDRYIAISSAKKPGEDGQPAKTGGEHFYDVFQFFFGKVFIIAITAGLAFLADQKHGPDKIVGVPNYLKQFQSWFHNKVFHNTIYPVAEKGDAAKLVGAGLVNTMIACHGGNFFAPFIKSMENNREEIANWYNRRYGTEEDVKVTHERLKDTPKQNWSDVIKGRAVAWGTVFVGMTTLYLALGKSPKSGRFRLDVYEDKFARIFSGLTKGGKEIAATPIASELTQAQKENTAYRFGKVLALDLYATTGGLMVWNMFSRSAAKKRKEHEMIEAHHDMVLQGGQHHRTVEQAESLRVDTAQPEPVMKRVVIHGGGIISKDSDASEVDAPHRHRQHIKPKAPMQSSLSHGYAEMVVDHTPDDDSPVRG